MAERKSFKPATLRSVAERAGVSISTTSLILSGRAVELKISKACEERVRRAAKEVGYVGNYHARALLSGRSHTIGLAFGVVDNTLLASHFWRPIIAGVDWAIRRAGYDILLLSQQRSKGDVFSRGVEYLKQRRVDTMITMGNASEEAVAEAKALGRPLVQLLGQPRAGIVAVNLDPVPGIEEAMSHLAALGHRHVRWLGVRHYGRLAEPQRRLIYRRAAEQHGMSIDEAIIDHNMSGEEREIHLSSYCQTLAKERIWQGKVTAIACYNDIIGLALYRVLQERGLRIPEDISVIGFDDLDACYALPAMTTISHMLPEIGMKAGEIALQVAKGEEVKEGEYLIPACLIVRSSTAAPRK